MTLDSDTFLRSCQREGDHCHFLELLEFRDGKCIQLKQKREEVLINEDIKIFLIPLSFKHSICIIIIKDRDK